MWVVGTSSVWSMKARITALTVSLLLLGGVTACATQDSSESTDPATATITSGDGTADAESGTAADADAATIEMATSTLTVLSTGGEDKHVYRYPTAAAATQAIDFQWDTSFSQTIVDPSGTADTTPLTQESQWSIPLALTGADGESAAVTWEIQDPTDVGDPTINEQVVGFAATLNRTEEGVGESIALTAPEAAEDAARQIAEVSLLGVIALPVVFPEEELGEGAQWEVVQAIDAGTQTSQKLTYTLVSRAADGTITLAVDGTRARPMMNLTAPDGSELTVAEATTTIRADLTLAPQQLWPTGTWTVDALVRYASDTGTEITQDTTNIAVLR